MNGQRQPSWMNDPDGPFIATRPWRTGAAVARSWNLERLSRGSDLQIAIGKSLPGQYAIPATRSLRIAIWRSLLQGNRRSPRTDGPAGSWLTLSLVIALLAFAGCSRSPEPTVQVTDARIRAVVPGQDKTAAYLTITNRGATPFVLEGVESAQARAIEIHVIERDGDAVRMRRIPELVVEPGATVRLQPGGLHLMIFGVTGPPDPFTAALLAADGTRIEVPFTLIAIGGK